MDKFCKELKAAIEDEAKAAKEYADMAHTLRESANPGVRSLSITLWKIAEDEKSHKGALEQIAALICPTIL